MGFKDVTIKEIANYTSLSRPSIYNYFETKEEIFLAILQREYWSWARELDEVTETQESMTRDEIAVVTDKQKRAMQKSNVPYVYLTPYEIARQCARKLLS